MPLFLPQHPHCRSLEELRVKLCQSSSRTFKLNEVYRGDRLLDCMDNWERANKLDGYLIARNNWRIVKLSHCEPTQSIVEVPRLLSILSGVDRPTMEQVRSWEGHGQPWSIQDNGTYYIVNGHHRLWLCAAAGQKYVWMPVIDGELFTNYSVREYAI